MLLFAPILAFMATIPDADHRESIPRLVLTVLGIVVLLYFVWFSMRTEALIMGALLLVLWILPKFKGWGHRGHFHSFIMVFIFSLPLLYFSGLTLFILGFLFALSHLIIDQFTGKTPTLKIF